MLNCDTLKIIYVFGMGSNSTFEKKNSAAVFKYFI